MEENISSEEFEKYSKVVSSVYEELHKVIIGQNDMLKGITIALLAKGHILIEGVPGLAKTLAISTFARIVNLSFKRIQFTPDLLPGDITGTLIFNMKREEFIVEQGPVFANFILADEINRAPAKVQSALLEAMQEKQVTIGKETHMLPRPFLVMATQNPIEQEGTYPLPEAQTDRFMMKLRISYPSPEEELRILDIKGNDEDARLSVIMDVEEIRELQSAVNKVHIDEKLKKYIVDIVYATRKPEMYGLEILSPLVRFGASPRGSISLLKTSKALALVNGRDYVTASDIKEMSYPVLRHRVLPSFEAEVEGVNSEDIISRILKALTVP